MVGVVIGFASTTASPAVANTERGCTKQKMSLREDAIRQAKLGQTKTSGPPYRIRNAKAFPSKGDPEKKRKSYAIDRPFRSDFESIGLSFFLIFLRRAE